MYELDVAIQLKGNISRQGVDDFEIARLVCLYNIY